MQYPDWITYEAEYPFMPVYDGKKYIFYPGDALALLISKGLIITNSHSFSNQLDDEHKRMFSFGVICNDIFVLGSGDAEEFFYDDIEELFNHYHKDNEHGHIIWVIKKRNEMPLKNIVRDIELKGIWDLNSMNLRENISENLGTK